MLEIFTVAGLATFEVYAAIPAGLAFELHPFIIFLASTIGGLTGVFVAAFLGDRIRAFFTKNKPPKEKKPTLAHRLWEKYGIIGLGFLGTVTVGAPISLAVGVGFNAPLKKLVMWCCFGVIFRCAVFTALGHYGLKMVI
ncbi:MAG: small multi-drug export protein [Ferruginibacter sp.]